MRACRRRAAGTANLTIMQDAFAQASGPIVIGHHCDLTGVISSWGVWHDKAAKAAVDIINQGGGIAGRKVELVTEDTEFESGERRAQAAQPDPALQCRVRRRFGAFRRDALGYPDRVRAQDHLLLDRRGDRSDRLEGNALFVPHRHRHLFDRGGQHAVVRREFRQGLDDHLCRLRLGPEHQPGIQALHREGRRQGARPASPVPLDTKDFVPYLAQIPADTEVLLPAFIGSLSVAFYTQAKSMGLDKKMKMFSSSASIEAIAPADIQGAAEGVYFFENFPRMLAAKNDEYHKEFNKLHGHRRRRCPRDRRPARHGQEPRLAGLGGSLRASSRRSKRPATRRARTSKASSRRSKACR